MKIRIDIDENLTEDEIIVRCRQLDSGTQRIYESLQELSRESNQIVLTKGTVEYYISLRNIVFFETDANGIQAHTKEQVYETGYKLYELEELLPGYFIRVSKSTILNLNHVYSISRNLTASSEVQFYNTHKQVYVSRNYYKLLKTRLEEKRKSI